jgi:cyclopropane fatty-acyl-phospholipid synthase-like methyltransferase
METLLIFLGLIIIIISFCTTLYAAIFYAPFAATPKNTIREALRITELKKGEIFYDLGSGNGQSLIIASKEFGAKAFGFELSFQHYLISNINIIIHRCSKMVSIFWKDFQKVNISDANVIFVWLTPKAFPKLQEKMKRELRKGTRVIAYSSPIKFWNPDKVVILPTSSHPKLYLYIVK